MMISSSALHLFLEKMTPSMTKGYMLQLCIDAIVGIGNENYLHEIKELLSAAQYEKKCQFFEDKQINSVFAYFPENHQDDISALLIKIQFILGVALTGNLNEKSPFYNLYHLKDDMDKLKNLTQESKNVSRISALSSKVQSLQPVLPETTFSMPFTPALLAQLEKSLRQADLSSLMRRQAVCALVGYAQPIELFEEIYVALADLKKALCPTVDIYQSPWLLDRLLETLDKRVLDNMAHHDAGAFRKNFSLNNAVKTILSQDFQAFNESIDPLCRKSILLEVKQHDIFSNLSAFLAARSFIAEQGYRLCVDMVTGDSLSLLYREKLGAEFVKLLWNENLLTLSKDAKFIEAVKNNNPKHIILCHVDDKRAIEWAQSLGISLFQGYYIQKLLYQTPKKSVK